MKEPAGSWQTQVGQLDMNKIPESKLVSQVRSALQCGVPLIAITTSDPGATQAAIRAVFPKRPKLSFDLANGLSALGPEGLEALQALGAEWKATKNDPVKAIYLASNLKPMSLLFYHNPQRHINGQQAKPALLQAIWNLRDVFKRDGRCLFLLMPTGSSLPVELRYDVMTFDDPRPDEEALQSIVGHTIDNAEVQLLDQKLTECRQQVNQAAETLRGTNAFQAEQLTAMSLTPEGFAHEYMQTQCRKMVEQVHGLSFERGGETFADIGGMDGGKEWAERIFKGPAAPSVVVRIEELEKSLAGSHGDTSGTSQDAMQVLLSEMQDNEWDGILAYGPPGCLHADTPIYDPVEETLRTVQERTADGTPFHVLSRNGNDVVTAMACPPQRYDAAEMVEFTLEDSRTITVTLGHRFWDGSMYVYASEVVERLRQCGHAHLPSSWDIDQLAQKQGVLRSIERASDSQDDYQACLYFDDVRLLIGEGADQSSSPSRGDAQQLYRSLSRKDGPVDRDTHSLCLSDVRLANYRFVGKQVYYDFHVPKHENYWAQGCFHHNSGKSLFAKSMANTYGARAIRFDINSCKGSLVGESQARVREAVEMIKTLGGKRVLFIGSCNKLEGIPAELQRRFRSGVWYFDAPDAAQRREIWKIHLARYQDATICDDEIDEVDDPQYVGSDIHNICEQSWKLGIGLLESKRFVISLAQRNPDVLSDARAAAEGRYWDVNTGSPYRHSEQELVPAVENYRHHGE